VHETWVIVDSCTGFEARSWNLANPIFLFLSILNRISINHPWYCSQNFIFLLYSLNFPIHHFDYWYFRKRIIILNVNVILNPKSFDLLQISLLVWLDRWLSKSEIFYWVFNRFLRLNFFFLWSWLFWSWFEFYFFLFDDIFDYNVGCL